MEPDRQMHRSPVRSSCIIESFSLPYGMESEFCIQLDIVVKATFPTGFERHDSFHEAESFRQPFLNCVMDRLG